MPNYEITMTRVVRQTFTMELETEDEETERSLKADMADSVAYLDENFLEGLLVEGQEVTSSTITVERLPDEEDDEEEPEDEDEDP